MKKTLYGFVAILITLWSFAAQVQAGCPPGYTSSTVSSTYYYGIGGGPTTFNCDITIEVCCKLDAANNRIDIQISNVYGTNNNCIAYLPDFVDFLKWLHKTALRQGYESCSPQYYPCDNPYYQQFEYSVTSFQCYKYSHQRIAGYVFRTLLVPCEMENHCWSQWKVCTDYSQNEPVTKYEFVSGGRFGFSHCATTPPILPPQNDPIWLTEFETSCFSSPCPY